MFRNALGRFILAYRPQHTDRALLKANVRDGKHLKILGATLGTLQADLDEGVGDLWGCSRRVGGARMRWYH